MQKRVPCSANQSYNKAAFGAPAADESSHQARPNQSMEDTTANDELARVNRTLRTVSAGNRTLLRATDEMELLNAMCQVVVDTGGYKMALVGYAINDPDKSIRHLAGV